MKLRLLFIFLLIFITACSTETVITDETIFHGEGKHWKVRYIYNPKQYEEKKTNWVEIEFKDNELSQEELKKIDIEFESNDGVITGNVGDMVTEIDGKVVAFLIGTVNRETYEEDKYKITINYSDKKDVIKLQK